MPFYFVDISTRYKVEADTEVEARFKAGIEDSNVQLDEYGFRIDNVMQGIKYIGSQSDAEEIVCKEDPHVIDMPTTEEIMAEIYKLPRLEDTYLQTYDQMPECWEKGLIPYLPSIDEQMVTLETEIADKGLFDQLDNLRTS